LKDRGLGLATISYDPVDVLAGFSKQHGITFPMLSDVGSETIKRYSILKPSRWSSQDPMQRIQPSRTKSRRTSQLSKRYDQYDGWGKLPQHSFEQVGSIEQIVTRLFGGQAACSQGGGWLTP